MVNFVTRLHVSIELSFCPGALVALGAPELPFHLQSGRFGLNRVTFLLVHLLMPIQLAPENKMLVTTGVATLVRPWQFRVRRLVGVQKGLVGRFRAANLAVHLVLLSNHCFTIHGDLEEGIFNFGLIGRV
jgi:hypothetical protein